MFNFLTKQWLRGYYNIRVICIKCQNSKILLQMHRQVTCKKSSGLHSDMCPTVVAAHFSSALSSVSLLSGFVVGPSLSLAFQPAVMCVCVDVVPICSSTIYLPTFLCAGTVVRISSRAPHSVVLPALPIINFSTISSASTASRPNVECFRSAFYL